MPEQHFPSHTHPDDRITTFGCNVLRVIGEFNLANVQPYPAGAGIYTPASTPHFMWAKNGETVMQETGNGPTGLKFTTEIE